MAPLSGTEDNTCNSGTFGLTGLRVFFYLYFALFLYIPASTGYFLRNIHSASIALRIGGTTEVHAALFPPHHSLPCATFYGTDSRVSVCLYYNDYNTSLVLTPMAVITF